MEILDRYLEAVKKHLLWQRQDDIIAELRANLEAQLEDKEAALGRPLTPREAEDWLKQIGQPIQVAARYRPQRYLIGPNLFPTYWFVLRMVLVWATVIYIVASFVQIAVRNPGETAVLFVLLHVPSLLIQAAAWVTLVFAIIEFSAARNPKKFPTLVPPSADWTPGMLPPLGKEVVAREKQRSFVNAVTQVVFGFLFLVWWLLVPQHPYLWIGPGFYYWHSWPFQLAPIWVEFYWWVVAVNVVQLVWRSVDLMRRSWQRPRTAQNFAISALGLIPLGLLLAVQDHAYLTLKHPALDQARYGAALHSINLLIQWCALAVCAIVVLQLLFGIGRMSVDAYRKRAAAMQ